VIAIDGLPAEVFEQRDCGLFDQFVFGVITHLMP
jgi:hypothetical protein